MRACVGDVRAAWGKKITACGARGGRAQMSQTNPLPSMFEADGKTPRAEFEHDKGKVRAQKTIGKGWTPPKTFGKEPLPSFREMITTPDPETGISVLHAVTGYVHGLSKLEELRLNIAYSDKLMKQVRAQLADVLAAMRLAGNPPPQGINKPSVATLKMLLCSVAKPLAAPDIPTPGTITIEKMFVTHTNAAGATFILCQWVGHALRLAACSKPGGADCWASVELNPELATAVKYLPTVEELAAIFRVELAHMHAKLGIKYLNNRVV